MELAEIRYDQSFDAMIAHPQNADESLERVRALSEHRLQRSCRRDFRRVKVFSNLPIVLPRTSMPKLIIGEPFS